MAQPSQHADDYDAGMAAFNSHDYERAMMHLERVTGNSSLQSTLARFYTGQAHLRLGMQRFGEARYAAAAEHFRRAAEIVPGGGGLCRYLATCYVALGKHEQAAAEIERALSVNPNDVDTRIRYALVTWKQGLTGHAERILRDGLARQPGEPELLYQLATLAASEDRIEEATDLLEQCLQSDPGHARAHVRLAQCHGARKEYEKAMQHLGRAQQLEPNDAMIAFQASLLAGRYKAKQRPDASAWKTPSLLDLNDRRAIERLAAMVREEPEFVDAFLTLPASAVDKDVFTALLSVLREAIEEQPTYADLRHRCSQILVRLQRIDEALAEAEQAVQINPQYTAAMIQLAQLYQTTNREQDAIERLRQAIEYGANYPDVHYLMGKLYQGQGLLDEARLAYSKALELNTNYDAARHALASLAA